MTVILTTECDEKPISILETGTRISVFQSHVRDMNENFFLSISCFETRTRIEIGIILARIFWELHSLLVYWYFQKTAVNFSKCLEVICLFFSRNLNENLNFETRTGILFYHSRDSRREREIENDFSRSSGKKLSWFSREFPGTGIPVTLWTMLH